MIFQTVQKWFSTLLEFLLHVFIITFPFFNYSLYLYTGTTTRAIDTTLLVTVLGIALGALLVSRKVRLVIPRSFILLSLGIYFVSVCVSAFLGYSFHTSFWSTATRLTGIWYFMNLGFLLLLFLQIVPDEVRLRKIILSVITSMALYSVLALLSPEGLGVMFKGYQNDGFTFGNSTFAGMYIFGAFVLALYYVYTQEQKKWWAYCLPVLVLINPFIINSKIFLGDFSLGFLGEAKASAIVSFASIFAFGVSYLISKIQNTKMRMRMVVSVFVMTLIVLGFVGVSLLSKGGYIREVYLKQATLARPLVWETSSKVIADRPMLGWGIDNFERVFEKYYDNRLLQDEYGNEAWFDRAHNIFLDQAIDNGLIGLALYILIFVVLGVRLLMVVIKSQNRNHVVLAVFLLIYFGMHFLELQTAFDTSVSFVMCAFMLALAIYLECAQVRDTKVKQQEYAIDGILAVVSGIVLLGCLGWSSFVGLVPFIRTQNANAYMRTVGYSEIRLAQYDTLFGSPIDTSLLIWRTSADLQRGIVQNPKVLEDPKKVASIDKEFKYLEKKYREYLASNPTDYRAYLNLADILIYVRLFEDDRLSDAEKALDEAVLLVPQNPQAYWMKAISYVYMAKFQEAKLWAEKALALNPNIKESQNVMKYVEDSAKTFPEIDLYFFRQT